MLSYIPTSLIDMLVIYKLSAHYRVVNVGSTITQTREGMAVSAEVCGLRE